jgi:hypothetical protein
MIPKVQKYDFGSIVIDGKEYTSDVIVFPDKVRDHWWRKEGHRLDIDDLEEVLEFKPEVLVIGTGYSGVMEVPEETLRYLQMKNIEVHVAPTREAIKIFNGLGGKRVVGAFHLTC